MGNVRRRRAPGARSPTCQQRADSYNGQWVTWEIPIPDTYTCNDADPLGCWTKLRFIYPVGTSVTDTTTWSAYILGEPVRIIQ